MTSATSTPNTQALPAKPVTNHTATVALVVAIVGFLTTQIPFFAGLIAGGPEDIAALVLAIIGIVAAFRRGTGKARAIAAAIIAVAAVVGISFGDGWLW